MYYLGIDLGGTNIKANLYNEEFENVEEEVILETPRFDYDLLLAQFNKAFRSFHNVKGVGISIPGHCNDDGIVVDAGAVQGMRNKPLLEDLKNLFNCPIVIENDGWCAAYAEFKMGAGKDKHSMIMATLGTGVGGGFIVEGELHKGAHFEAMEVSSIVVKADPKKPVFLGDFGAEGLVHSVANKMGLDPHTFNGIEAFVAIKSGDKRALEAYKEWLFYLSVGLYNAGIALDPEVIVIGGGISNVEHLVDDINDMIFRQISDYPKWTLVQAHHKHSAGSLGAARLLFDEKFRK